MTPPLAARASTDATLTAAEQAIADTVLYASVFDYPLTLAQLRRTLIESEQTATEIATTWQRSVALQRVVGHADGLYFPAGRVDLVAERRRREARSRAFLARHRRLLRLIAAWPYVDMVALSGSIAHLNLETGGDLDLFLVTRGRRVWLTTVTVIVLARLLRRRRTLCANYVIADTALAVDRGRDLFTASQILHLRPLSGVGTYARLLRANRFVSDYYRNAHGAERRMPVFRTGVAARLVKRSLEWILVGPSAAAEWVCFRAYRAYLQRRRPTWASPDGVRLEPDRLKLHTRSHRQRVMTAFEEKRRAIDG